MKKVTTTLALAVLTLLATAQTPNPKYVAAMQKQVVLVDSFKTDQQALSATFKRIGDAEKKEALPYYYAALTKVNAGRNMKAAKDITQAANEADSLLAKAIAINKTTTSEFETIRGMVFGIRMNAEPDKFMQYGPAGSAAFGKAIAMDTTNPRPLMMLGVNTFYTPEQFGGGKKKAAAMIAKAEQLFATFKPLTNLHPIWGRGMLYGFAKGLVK